VSLDGAAYIASAIEKGATRIIIERGSPLPNDARAAIANHNIELIEVENTRRALALLSAEANGFPAKRLHLIGITGTKGKTTTAFLLHHILKHAGIPVALLSTVHNQIGDTIIPAELTTAQPDFLHYFFARCVSEHITHVVMEVAAQAFSLSRVEGLEFSGALFTNFSHEHLEFYKDMDEYFQAKCQLFALTKKDAPILFNADDARVASVAPSGAHSFGFGRNTTFGLRVERSSPDGMQVAITGPVTASVFCPTLFGHFNAYNIGAAVAMAYQFGVSVSQIIDAIATSPGVRGRLERYKVPNGAICVIDYAHTPDSYRAVLSTLREQTDHLIVIFGAGGRRDKFKRPIMGGIAAEYANMVILTSDNPRDEDPVAIIEDIRAGIPEDAALIVELDREKAIQYAYHQSHAGSIIVVLGKGPDEYQIVGTQKIPFSEKNIIQNLC
jgi:UDP-N-acetylmuramoyl-L-alanyl-D-glutamate--2,6-diaminopimelate ligase